MINIFQYNTPGNKRGFTLVEMLVSMAILAMIVMLMSRIFADGTSAYRHGMKTSDQNLQGRVILDFIARELKQAIVDDNLILRVQSSDNPYGTGLGDWISFATLGGEEEGQREARLIRYYVRSNPRTIGGAQVDTYQLMRAVTTNSNQINQAYRGQNSQWPDDIQGAANIARNISGFAIKLYDGPDSSGNFRLVRDIGDERDLRRLPAYADIYMALLGDSDLVEAGITNDANFIQDREMIFMKRVYFRNRQGYNTGYGRDLYSRGAD